MSRSPLLVGVGGVLSGVAVAMTMLAIAFEPFLFFVALPFGAAGYLIWYQGTGRLAARIRRRARRADGGRVAGDGRDQSPSGGGRRGPDAGRGRRSRARARAGAERERRARAGFGGGRRRAGTGRGPGGTDDGPGGYAPGAIGASGPTTEEAYRRLGLDPGSDPDAIREAYREKVKEVHPDRGGTEEEFKAVTEAFETLDERVN